MAGHKPALPCHTVNHLQILSNYLPSTSGYRVMIGTSTIPPHRRRMAISGTNIWDTHEMVLAYE